MSNTRQLTYGTEVQNVTHNSGQIILTVTPDKDPMVCQSITIDVPIGEKAEDMFIKPPVIKSNLSNWAPTSYISTAPATTADGQTTTTYQRFVVYNQQADCTLGFTTEKPLIISITGGVNTVKSTEKPKLLLEEISAADKAHLSQAQPTKQTKELNKAHSQLLFIESFYASGNTETKPVASTADKSGTSVVLDVKPVTKFRSGENFELSWESNGASYDLFQDDKPIITLKDGETTSHIMAEGIAADTTFVLRANNSKDDVHLYASLTVMVSNPAYGPETVTLKSLLGQVDDAALILALELYEDDIISALISASGTDVDNKIRASEDSEFAAILSYNYIEGMPLRDILGRYMSNRDNGMVRMGFGVRMGFALRKALRRTSDHNLKEAIEKAPDASLRNALKPTDTTAIKLAINENDAPTIKRLLGQSNDSRIQFALRLVDNPATTFVLKQSDDTAHCLRLSDGTPNGNIVLQTLSGEKMSGLVTINFNGYYCNGEQRFNAAKSRWRIGVDQRYNNNTDNFFIDTYSDNVNASKPPAFIITANSNVGIGTFAPSYPLEVAGNGSGQIGGQYGFLGKSGANSGTSYSSNSYCIRANGNILASEFHASSDHRLKTVAGYSDASADLVLLRRLHITDYTMRDQVQFGGRAFKKLIGQELEKVFPQAVHQHTGFLPDIYARPSQVQRQGEALRITLPTGLPEAAAAGQRLKLIGPAGEVLATLAEAAEAGSQQLLVTGANSLADTPEEVFVFGLERTDVRTVDYEAVSMLNVSATQALARQVDDLHQQNAALHEQNRAQGIQLNEMQAALHLIQQQMAHLLSAKSIVQPA